MRNFEDREIINVPQNSIWNILLMATIANIIPMQNHNPNKKINAINIYGAYNTSLAEKGITKQYNY